MCGSTKLARRRTLQNSPLRLALFRIRVSSEHCPCLAVMRGSRLISNRLISNTRISRRLLRVLFHSEVESGLQGPMRQWHTQGTAIVYASASHQTLTALTNHRWGTFPIPFILMLNRADFYKVRYASGTPKVPL